MISRYTYQGLTWIDVLSPTADELVLISDEFSIPHHLSGELLEPTMRSKTDLYDDFIYVVLHFPQIKADKEDEEIDFLMGKKFFITVRYDESEVINNLLYKLENNSALQNNKIFSHPSTLFVSLMKKYYHKLLIDLDSLARNIAVIERAIFTGKQEKVVKDISFVSRELIDFNRAVCLHKDVLESYYYSGVEFFGQSYAYNASILKAEFGKVYSVLQSHKETLAELQKTNDSLLSTKQNSIMKNLTIVSFVTFPLLLFSGIFGMNTTPDLIFIETPRDFLFVLGAMFLTSITMFLFFKLQKWL
jgi:magnesium transporter